MFRNNQNQRLKTCIGYILALVSALTPPPPHQDVSQLPLLISCELLKMTKINQIWDIYHAQNNEICIWKIIEEPYKVLRLLQRPAHTYNFICVMGS